jgi:hypothetical protein
MALLNENNVQIELDMPSATTIESFNETLNKYSKFYDESNINARYVDALYQVQMSNMQKVMRAEEQRLIAYYNRQEELNDIFQKRSSSKGIKAENIDAANKRANQLILDKQEEIARLKRRNLSKKEYNEELKKINKKYKDQTKHEDSLVKHRLKLNKKADAEDFRNKMQNATTAAEKAAALQEAKENGLSALDRFAGRISSTSPIGKMLNNPLQGAVDILSDYGKKLEKDMDEVAKAQGTVDTRLNGSKNAKRNGSY